jgi:hypothetical protein
MTYPSSYSKLAGLVDVVRYFSEVYGVPFERLFDGYQTMIDTLRDPNYYGNGEMAASRSWLWQTCKILLYNENKFFRQRVWILSKH